MIDPNANIVSIAKKRVVRSNNFFIQGLFLQLSMGRLVGLFAYGGCFLGDVVECRPIIWLFSLGGWLWIAPAGEELPILSMLLFRRGSVDTPMPIP